MNNQTYNTVEEPDNYQEVRSSIKKAMIQLGEIRKSISPILDLQTLQEDLESEIKDLRNNLINSILILGKIQGYCLADDIIENRNAKS